MSTIDRFTEFVTGAIDARGVQVKVKTDLGPEITVYDSDDPASESKPFVKYGVRVTTRDGKELATYGEPPRTNIFKAGLVVAVVGAGLFITVRGIRSLI